MLANLAQKNDGERAVEAFLEAQVAMLAVCQGNQTCGFFPLQPFLPLLARRRRRPDGGGNSASMVLSPGGDAKTGRTAQRPRSEPGSPCAGSSVCPARMATGHRGRNKRQLTEDYIQGARLHRQPDSSPPGRGATRGVGSHVRSGARRPWGCASSTACRGATNTLGRQSRSRHPVHSLGHAHLRHACSSSSSATGRD